MRDSIITLTPTSFAVGIFLFKNEITPQGVAIRPTGELYIDGMLKELINLGYYKKLIDESSYVFIRETGNIIFEVTPQEMKEHFFYEHLNVEKPPLEVSYKGSRCKLSIEQQREVYLRKFSAVFKVEQLEHLPIHEKQELRDNMEASYFPYQNQIVKVTSDGIVYMSHSDLDNIVVWKDHIIPRNFRFASDYETAHYARFIQNVAGEKPGKHNAFKSAIGYLINNHNEPSRSQVVVCYDEVPTSSDKPMGGTGKGLFCNAIKQIRHIYKQDGKSIRRDDRFKFQGITNRTQVYWLDDVHKEFPFDVLHSVTTDGWTIEKKYRDAFYLPPNRAPKIILCSNKILPDTGSTNKRRQFILEFTDHYSSKIVTGAEEPVKEEHGCIFFNKEQWDETEWNRFDSYMLTCVKYYLSEGLKPYTQVGQENSRLLQQTNESFIEWAEENLKANVRYKLSDICREYSVSSGENCIPRDFNKWIGIYAEHLNLELEKKKSNGKQYIVLKSK